LQSIQIYHSFIDSSCVLFLSIRPSRSSPITTRCVYPRRLALHKYDPPDLQASLASVVTSNSGMDNDNSTTTKSLPLVQSIQDRELENAKKNGLLVDLGERSTGLEGRKESFLPTTTSKSSPTSVVETFMMGATSNPSVDDMRELDLWESAATPHGEADNLDWDNYGDDDSDDDLL